MNQIQEHKTHTKDTNFVKFFSFTIESCLLWHIFP